MLLFLYFFISFYAASQVCLPKDQSAKSRVFFICVQYLKKFS